MNIKMNLLPWRRVKTALKLSDVNFLTSTRKINLKNKIENANTFYKKLVGMDKVEMQRSTMINLQGLLNKSKNELDIEKYKLKLTQYEMKRTVEKIGETDRLKQYERFTDLLKKEQSLKYEEEELVEKVKLKEKDREVIEDKLNTTNTTILMLEKDHIFYLRWLKYLCAAFTFASSGFYFRDNKKILDGISEIKKMNKCRDGVEFTKIYQLLVSGAYGGIVSVGNGIWWGCGKCYGGLKCGAQITWNTTKSVASITGSGIKVGAEKTMDATKWSIKAGTDATKWSIKAGTDATKWSIKAGTHATKWGYRAACGGCNQVKKLIYPEKND